jgi:hypothetical protein
MPTAMRAEHDHVDGTRRGRLRSQRHLSVWSVSGVGNWRKQAVGGPNRLARAADHANRSQKGTWVLEMVYARTPVAIGSANKTVVDCGTLEGVGQVLDVLVQAVADGSLDAQPAEAAEAAKARRTKKAA